MLPNYLKCLWNCECYMLCYASSCLFPYFGFFGSHYDSSVGSVMSRLQNVKSQYQYVYWKVLTAALVELWTISSSAEVSRFLEYQFHVEGIVLCFWSSLGCLKSWIAIYYRGLTFPQRAEVLFVLGRDAAFNSLSGHSAWKSAFLVLVWFYQATGDREQDLWMYWHFKAALSSGVTSQ